MFKLKNPKQDHRFVEETGHQGGKLMKQQDGVSWSEEEMRITRLDFMVIWIKF